MAKPIIRLSGDLRITDSNVFIRNSYLLSVYEHYGRSVEDTAMDIIRKIESQNFRCSVTSDDIEALRK